MRRLDERAQAVIERARELREQFEDAVVEWQRELERARMNIRDFKKISEERHARR